jgi:hypothetical protein
MCKMSLVKDATRRRKHTDDEIQELGDLSLESEAFSGHFGVGWEEVVKKMKKGRVDGPLYVSQIYFSKNLKLAIYGSRPTTCGTFSNNRPSINRY